MCAYACGTEKVRGGKTAVIGPERSSSTVLLYVRMHVHVCMSRFQHSSTHRPHIVLEET